MVMNLQYFGGRGSSSGIGKTKGDVFYMTGNRNVLTHWDDEENYHEKEIVVKEKVRVSFKTREEAVKYAKKNGYKYLSL